MSIALVVVHPFADYAKGDRITDADTVAKVLEHHSFRVVKVTITDDAQADSAGTNEVHS